MIAQRSSAAAAFLWGSILGSAVVLLDIVDHFILGGVERLGPAVAAVLPRRHLVVIRPAAPLRVLLVEGIVLLIVLLLFFLAGALAARQASATAAGIEAGIVAGAFVAIAHLVIVVITVLLAVHPAVVAAVARGVVVAVLAFLLAVAAAALGALVGRGSHAGGTPLSMHSAPPTPVPARTPEAHTPTPSHYGPENDYPTAPLQSSSD